MAQEPRRNFLPLLLVVVALGAVLFWLLTLPNGAGGQEPDRATQVDPGAAGAQSVTGAGAKPADVDEPARTEDATTRRRAPARRLLLGRARMPNRLAATGGRVLLHRAGARDARSLAGLMSGVAERDRENLRESFAAFGAPMMRAELEADGSFEFRDPPPGPVWVVIRHPLAKLPSSLRAVVPEEGRKDLGDLELELAASLVVEVRDARERPVRNAHVAVFTALAIEDFMNPEKLGDMGSLITRAMPVTQRTDDTGRADFAGLRRSAGYLVRVHAPGLARTFREIELQPGQRRVLTIRMFPGAGLALRITGDDDAPLPRCRVSLRYEKAPPLHHDYQTARARHHELSADREGRVDVDSLRTGQAELRVSCDGYLTTRLPIELRYGERLERDVRLRIGEVIAGRIVGAKAEPLPDARVLLLDSSMSKGILGMDLSSFVGNDLIGMRFRDGSGIECDEEGRFRIGGLEPGESRKLMATAPGHAIHVSELLRAGAQDVEIRLEQSARIVGRVLDDRDGSPISDYVVRANIRAWMFMDRPVAQRSIKDSEEGRFELSDFAPQSVTLEIEAPGRSKFVKRLRATSEEIDLGDIRLGAPAAIRGVVHDGAGRPMAGAEVRIAKGGLADMGMLSALTGAQRAKTNAKGEFELRNVRTGRMRLLAEKDGYALTRSSIVRVVEGEITEGVRIQLNEGGALIGRLLDPQNEPVPNWSVYAQSQRASTMKIGLTDHEGRFEFRGLAAGPYELQAFPKDLQSSLGRRMRDEAEDMDSDKMMSVMAEITKRVVKRKVAVKDGETAEVELRVPARQSGEGLVRVLGSVRVGARTPESGLVELMPPGSAESPLLTTLSEGRFTFEAVPPGNYRVRVRGGIFSGALGEPRPVLVPEGPTYRMDLRFPAGRLLGVIRDRDTREPVANCVVTLEREGSNSSVDPHADAEIGEGVALSGASGSFRYEGLEPGRYRVHARENALLGGRGRSGSSEWITLGGEQQRDDLEVLLGGAGSVRVTVRSAGRPMPGALLRLLDSSGSPTGYHHLQVTGPEGSARFEGLPPGTYRVSADGAEHAPAVSEEFRVSRGSTATTSVELVAGTPVELVADKGSLDLESDEILAWSVWDARGNVLRTGRLPASVVKKRIESTGRLPMGSYEPGNYRLRVESRSLGRKEWNESVPASGAAHWRLRGD